MSLEKRLVFNCCFYDTDISQGSVETYVRCGGIFGDSIITNFLLILTVKYYENRLIFGKVKAYKTYKIVPIFWATL